jgi:RNA polymerase sigma factor (sigma-70 family)
MKREWKIRFDEIAFQHPAVGGGMQSLASGSWRETDIATIETVSWSVPAREPVSPPEGGNTGPVPPDDLESTRSLLELARGGDDDARDRLVRRYLPALKAWARGRMPLQLRRVADTDDLVQMTFMRALDRVDKIKYLHEGGFFAYLRTILRNQIVDLVRRDNVRPEGASLPPDVEEHGPSPFDEAVGHEIMERYDAALETLTEQQRAAVSLRIEIGLPFKEVADVVGCPSANAARMLVARALVRLSEIMDECGT